MPSLFDGTCGLEDPKTIYDLMDAKYPGSPCSESRELWELQRECKISLHSKRRETMLEKAVAILAESCHMPWWFNQCPVASGIVDPRSDGGRCVDLIHWSSSSGCARFIELKWNSNDPLYALRQILRYGVAYIFCRVHRRELPLQGKYYRPLMDARKIALEVAAPRRFYSGHDEKQRFGDVSKSLDDFARSKTSGDLAMSLDALAFPAEFNQVPFADGQDVSEKCFTKELSHEGRMVRDAFEGLAPAWPDSDDRKEQLR